MAYAPKELRVAPGSLNVLTPGDQDPQIESLQLTDWWPAAGATLEQAPSPVTLFGGGPYDGIMKTGDNVYTSGGDGQVFCNGSQIDSGYGVAYPTGMLAFQGFAWFMSQSKQARHDGTNMYPWAMPAPGSAPGLADAGADTGVKRYPLQDTYCFTWVSPNGESNPSPSAVFGPPDDSTGHSTVITRTGTPPPGVTGWNIYRQVPGLGGDSTDANTVPYLLNATPIPIATSSLWDTGSEGNNLDDASLLRLGIIIDATHDPAPPAAVIANQSFNGRIVVGNSTAHPNRIWWTPALEPGYFRGAGDTYDGDWTDVGTDREDEIRAIVVRPGMLVIYRAKSIWRHIGDLGDDNAVLEPACLDVGIAGVRAVASTAAGDYFAGTGGDAVYRFNNDWPIKISQRIEPLLRGLPNEFYGAQDPNYAKVFAIGHHRGRVYCSYAPLTVPKCSFIYHIESDRWFASSALYAAYVDAGDSFLGANETGAIELESQYAYSAAISYQTQFQDCNQPDHEKTWGDLVIVHNTQGATIYVDCILNKGQISFNLVNFSSTSRTRSIFPLNYPSDFIATSLRGQPIECHNISIRLSGGGAGGSVPVVIESPLLLHYYLQARRAKSFDSGNTRHNLDGVGRIDQIEVDIDVSSPGAAVHIQSDIPGGVMTDRTPLGVQIPTTNGRQVFRLVPPASIDGRLFRHQISTIGTMRVYAYRVRMLPIGVYLDGANPGGEFWYVNALAPGEE